MADQYNPVQSNTDVTIDCDNDNNGTTNIIKFSHNNGTELMRIQENGSVGIGTTSPAAALDVSGVIRGVGYSSPSSGSGTEIGYNSGSGYGYIQPYNRTSPAFLPMFIDGSSLYLNSNSSGNVGIGTTSPSYKLTVSISGSSCDGISVTDGSGNLRGFLARSGLVGGQAYGFLELYDDSNTIQIKLHSESHDSFINYGNVGIGTTSPTAKLDVNPGTISDSNPNIRLRGVTSTAPSGGNDGDIQVYSSGATKRLYIKIASAWYYVNLTAA